ncbi:MAG: hypothetical protein IKI21_00680 [Oscillospiraceae bacterium]|nr:hypothetical protein [Oscillospiraceae bacterium]
MDHDMRFADDVGRQLGDSVPVKVERVFDSCSDRDCLTNVPVVLDDGELPANIQLVKCRCVSIDDVCMRLDAVPFNRGFYNIDITFTFRVELLAYTRACETPEVMTGTVYASKNAILYGSESNALTFSSDGTSLGEPNECCGVTNLPTCHVQVVPPLALETRIASVACPGDPAICPDPDLQTTVRTVVMTLGLFSVIELTRPVTMLVPTYDYTIPTKECTAGTEAPCAVFDKMRFPTEEFSPRSLTDSDTLPGCDTCGS